MQQTPQLTHKTTEQVFTPDYIVKAILDWCGYQGEGIQSLKKKSGFLYGLSGN